MKIIVFIWVLSGLLALPYLFTVGVYDYYDKYPESRTCSIKKKYGEFMKTVIQLSVIFLFILPMTLISIMYVLIGITLWKSQTKHKSFDFSKNSSRSKQSEYIGSKVRSLFKRNKNSNFNSSSKNASINLNDELANLKDSVSQKLKPSGSSYLVSGLSGGGGSVHKSGKLPKNLSEFSVSNCLENDMPTNVNNYNTNGNDRTSKDFEHISYRARQSRRDVVKMLCKINFMLVN